MAQIGTFSKYQIPVFEEHEVGTPRVGVNLGGGEIGYLNLVPYPNRDMPSLCCEINGQLYGTKNSTFKIIDDFEDNNVNEYYIPGSSGFQSTVQHAALTQDSSRGLLMENRQMFSLPGDGLPYYPQRGDRFEFYVEHRQHHNTPAFWRFDFGLQHYNTTDLYRLELESDPTAGSDFSFEKRRNGSNVIIRATEDNRGGELNTTYRVVVDWGFNRMEVNVFEPDGTRLSPNLPLSFTDGQWDGGGIAWETNGFMRAAFDTCRTIPD